VCGRYSLACDPDELVEAFDLPGLTWDYLARYNIAPGQRAPVVAEDRKGRRAGLMTWGFVPARKAEAGEGFINARAESVAEKVSFREAYARRRCLVPADGFYEWRREGGAKQPYWFHPAGGGLISFAGIWERWRGPEGDEDHTFAILTTDANADVSPVHDRMPVVIGVGDRGLWLDRDAPLADVGRLLHPPAPGTFASHPVSTRVNRPADDDAALIEPVG